MKRLITTLVLCAGLLGTAQGQSVPPAAAPAASHNPHKERDHRFKACKAEAKAAGVSSADLNAYIAQCMKKAN